MGVDHTSVRKSIRAARQANPDWGHLAEKMVKGGVWAEDRLLRVAAVLLLRLRPR